MVLVLVDLDVETGGAPIHMVVRASPRAGVGVIVRAHYLVDLPAAVAITRGRVPHGVVSPRGLLRTHKQSSVANI